MRGLRKGIRASETLLDVGWEPGHLGSGEMLGNSLLGLSFYCGCRGRACSGRQVEAVLGPWVPWLVGQGSMLGCISQGHRKSTTSTPKQESTFLRKFKPQGGMQEGD